MKSTSGNFDSCKPSAVSEGTLTELQNKVLPKTELTPCMLVLSGPHMSHLTKPGGQSLPATQLVQTAWKYGNWGDEKYLLTPKSMRRQDPNNYSDTETRALSKLACELKTGLENRAQSILVHSAQRVPEPDPLPGIFFDTRPDSVLKIIGQRVTRNIGYYPKYLVLPDISGKPEVLGITRYLEYSQT